RTALSRTWPEALAPSLLWAIPPSQSFWKLRNEGSLRSRTSLLHISIRFCLPTEPNVRVLEIRRRVGPLPRADVYLIASYGRAAPPVGIRLRVLPSAPALR